MYIIENELEKGNPMVFIPHILYIIYFTTTGICVCAYLGYY